jgi:phosphopantothenoylcysteine decarboxylase / phosphopantothenate---cysteine ligase
MKILVTAGPTREPIDPVRFISNRSSGKMGYAVAHEAVRRGHVVRLISGPVQIPPPPGVELIRVETAEQMLAAVRGNLEWCDVLVMAAAVADWRPAVCAAQKMKKSGAPAVLALEPAPDILKTIRPYKGGRFFVGFAAETGDPLPEARRKLVAKGLDLVVANDVTRPGAGFEVDTNEVTLVFADGRVRDLPTMPKTEVAGRLLGEIELNVPYRTKNTQ